MGSPDSSDHVPSWAGDLALDANTLLLNTTAASFGSFLRNPPAWEIEHVAVIAWVTDPTVRSVVLVRHRLHGWSCPGGHLEAAESLRGAVERELFEEIGVVGVAPLRPRTVSRTAGCARHPSATHWTLGYHFVVDPTAALVPEHDQPARWWPIDQLPSPRPGDIDQVAEHLRSLR